jgi:hypothetical protein
MRFFSRGRNRKQEEPPQPRTETGQFSVKTPTATRQISQIAQDVHAIIAVSDEIRAMGGSQNSDDMMMVKGIEVLGQILAQKQQKPPDLPQIPAQNTPSEGGDIPPELVEQFKKRYGFKLKIVKKAVAKEDFAMIIKMIKTFKSDQILNMIYEDK